MILSALVNVGESSQNKFLKVKDVRKLYVSKNMISTGEIQLMNFGNFITYSDPFRPVDDYQI